jgi:hypothetical protein
LAFADLKNMGMTGAEFIRMLGEMGRIVQRHVPDKGVQDAIWREWMAIDFRIPGDPAKGSP